MPDLLALNVAWGARAASMATSSSGARAGLYLVLGAWPAAAAGQAPYPFERYWFRFPGQVGGLIMPPSG